MLCRCYKTPVGSILEGQAVLEETLDPEDRTDTLSRNVGTELLFYAE
jgi:hypothetical protein